MWLLSLLSLPGGCAEGSIATSLQGRDRLPDPAVLPLQVRTDPGTGRSLSVPCCTSRTPSTCVCVCESVLALCVLSVHTWLSSFNKVHKDPFNTQLFIRCTAPSWTCSMCQLTYNRGRSVMLMSFTFMNAMLSNMTQTKRVFIRHWKLWTQAEEPCLYTFAWVCEVKGQAVWMFSSWIALFRKQEPVLENNCPCKGRSEAGSRS